MNRPGPAQPAPSARELANLLAAARAAGAPRALAVPAIASFFMLVTIFLHASPARAFLLATPGSRAAFEESQMKMVGAAVVSSVLAASGAVAQDAVQWRVEDGGNGHWYELRDMNSLSWNTHKLRAEAVGAHLVTMLSIQEVTFVRSLIPMSLPGYGQNYLFGPTIGLRQEATAPEPAQGWTWVTGELLEVSDWFPGEPNDGPSIGEHWARMRLTTGVLGWNDVIESMVSGDLCCNPLVEHAVIEWSADCNGDGIVDYGQIRAGELDDTNGNNIPDCCETGTACTCAGDVDDSGAVNGVDLAAILNVWGTSGGKYPGADCNGDGVVDAVDLSIVLNAWGPCN